MRNKFYQDVWIRGHTVRNGDRPCIERYKVLKNFLERFKHPVVPIKLLDFGANMGYFSFNTARDFPNSQITLVDYEPFLPCVHELNGFKNTELIHRFVEDLDEFFEEKYYDVSYVMSFLHHLENYKEAIDLFLEHSNNVIFEIGYPDETPEVWAERVEPIYDYLQTKNPIQINKHLPHDRPIYYCNNREETFNGTVHGGAKQASQITFPTIEYQLQNMFGTTFYPGTLNIKLKKDIELKNHFWLADVYKIYPGYLNGFPVYMLETQSRWSNEIELISPVGLRERLFLNDGDEVSVSFEKKYCTT